MGDGSGRRARAVRNARHVAREVRVFAVIAGAALTLSGAAAATPAPDFSASAAPVRWSDVRFSWRPGCPVAPPQLRLVRVSYWGFDGRPHTGSLVVNRRATADLVKVFRRLYATRFPIRRLVPVSRYRGSDDASMAADNTSGFNCRRVAGPASGWSMHAYGLAIDINPVENPYVVGGQARPAAGRRYVDRARYRRGMVVDGGIVVRAFAGIGWEWGGRWTTTPDYQHFSTTGT